MIYFILHLLQYLPKKLQLSNHKCLNCIEHQTILQNVVWSQNRHILVAVADITQPAFTCSKSAIKTPEQCVKSVPS